MKGIVVESLSSGNRYARSERNFNPKREKKVRDLRPGETVIGFKTREKKVLSHEEDAPVLFDMPEGSPAGDTKETK